MFHVWTILSTAETLATGGEMAGKNISEIGVHLGSRMCKLFPDVVKTKASFWFFPNRIPMHAQGGPKNQLKVGSTWVITPRNTPCMHRWNNLIYFPVILTSWDIQVGGQSIYEATLKPRGHELGGFALQNALFGLASYCWWKTSCTTWDG